MRSQDNTFLSVAEAYFAHIKSEGFKKAKVHEREIRKEFVSCWAARPIHDITQHDLAAVINSIKQRGSPGQARELFGRAKALWRWAIGCGAYGLTASPADRLGSKALVGSKKSRTRVLSDDELRCLWQALDAEQYPWQPLYTLLVMSGQRLSDVSQRQLAGVRFQAEAVDHPGQPLQDRRRAGRATHQRDAGAARHAAAIRRRRVPVSRPAGVARQSPTFQSRSCDSTRACESSCRNCPTGSCTTFVGRCARSCRALPVEQHVRELVIGHSKPGLQRCYDLYQYVDEKRTALELWQAKLRDIVQPAPDNVTKLRARKKA